MTYDIQQELDATIAFINRQHEEIIRLTELSLDLLRQIDRYKAAQRKENEAAILATNTYESEGRN